MASRRIWNVWEPLKTAPRAAGQENQSSLVTIGVHGNEESPLENSGLRMNFAARRVHG